MNKSLLILGIFLLGVNTLCITYLLTRNNENAQSVNNRQVSKSVAQRTDEINASAFTSLQNKMEHLVNGALTTTAEITALRTELKNIKGDVNSLYQNSDDVPQLTEAEIQQKQIEAKQQYVSSLQSAPRNDAWASQMEDEMLLSIESAQLNGFGGSDVSIQSIECYTDNCLINITLSDSDNESMILAMLPWEVTAEFIPSENSALKGRMVITKI